MILKTLVVENFRQFYGPQSLTFSDHADRNVTVIYGPNGGGKTALLNAFTWAIYGQTSPRFELPADLINHRAWAEADVGAEVAARVTVVFEHEDQVYTVGRVTSDRKMEDGKAIRVRDGHASVSFVDEGGRTHDRTEHFEGTVNQILPDRLHRFFFFDGEWIEDLVTAESYAEIEDAIKTILGLKVIERSIRHLGDVRKTLEKELSDVGSDEVRSVQVELDAARDERDRKVTSREQALANRAANKGELDNVDGRLAELEEAAELQRRREELEEALRDIRAEIAARRGSLASKLSENGYLAFTDGLVDTTLAKDADLRVRKEIPTNIKVQFVDDLLESGSCICGTELHEGEVAYEKVAEWRQRAGKADVEEAWMRNLANVKAFKERRKELFSYVHETIRERAALRDQEKKTIDKLGAIKESIDRLDSEEVQGLEARRDELKQALEKEGVAIALAERDIQELDQRIAELERHLEEAGKAVEAARIAQRRVVVAREARDIFSSVLDLRTEEVRQQIDARVKNVYTTISFKPYVPTLDEDFRLELHKTSGDEDKLVAKSTGENQILSLAFVGAIAEHARDRYAEAVSEGRSDGLLSFQGGIYPVVMDSPFGSLDENYQGQIAKAIPSLAPQVIIFVSKSQGLNAVHDVLMPRVEREYVIQYHTPKADQERESITLTSGTHPYIEPTDGDFEWAAVEEA